MANLSQSDRLLDHFRKGFSITRIESFNRLGIIELSARITEMEKRGHRVHRETISVTNRFHEEIKVKRYWMEQ